MKFNGLKKKKKLLIGGIVLAVVVVIIISAFAKKKPAEVTQEVKNVKTEKITTGTISTEVEYASNLKPAKEVQVLPKTGGRVATVDVNIGDKVSVGQTLFTLDTKDYSAQLQQAEAGVSAASANLERTSDSGFIQQLLQAEQLVGKLQIQYNTAKDSYDRTQTLYSAEAVTKKDLDDAKAQYDAITIDLKNAQDSLELLKNKSGPQATQAAEAALEQAQAGVSAVQIQINNATITAPIAGVVSEKAVEVGELASGQSGSVTIIDSSSLEAEINIPDKMLEKIKVGLSVPVTINALPDAKIVGVIDNISPNTSSKNNFYVVKVKIDNSNGDIKAGMFAKISLPAEKKDNILMVPNETIKMENGVNYLYTVDNGQVKKISVETGISNEKFTEVTGKVQEGLDVITEGQNLLSDGEKVNLV
ncbi:MULTISPECIES: efflux RND transporter periplasmic adaptor subunit [unclassified Clostridium]|uniref:efflux RND transporter periplasmic adaptor subunit n=1 Tax=unclassified Clostridium TaxID=2614128 RepID=UPI0002977F9C|nr:MULTISPECIES: efflux RND transporter periplasmic adaptor subunit [unclassified Clostridium]EKQ57339.1 MAG: RND family efflux transporter, MFP subunit [Clostridium sp. Maddingley MBC34-26]